MKIRSGGAGGADGRAVYGSCMALRYGLVRSADRVWKAVPHRQEKSLIRFAVRMRLTVYYLQIV